MLGVDVMTESGSAVWRAEREWNGWVLREGGPADARASALLLPGAFCTAAFYDDLLADARLGEPGVRVVAATPPGFGGSLAPQDLSVEGYARITGELAAELASTVVVGHSYLANVAIEMAATGAFTGPIVLLSPCFSREDEEKGFRQIGRMSRVPGIGRLPWLLFPRIINSSMRGRLPTERHDELVNEMKSNDMKVWRRLVCQYFDYLDTHGSLTVRLCDSGVAAVVVRGDRDEIGLTDPERRSLDACPNVTMVSVSDSGHFVMTDQPSATMQAIFDAIGDGSAT